MRHRWLQGRTRILFGPTVLDDIAVAADFQSIDAATTTVHLLS